MAQGRAGRSTDQKVVGLIPSSVPWASCWTTNCPWLHIVWKKIETTFYESTFTISSSNGDFPTVTCAIRESTVNCSRLRYFLHQSDGEMSLACYGNLLTPSLMTPPPSQVTSCPWINPLCSNQNKHMPRPIAASLSRTWTSVCVRLYRTSSSLQKQAAQKNNFYFWDVHVKQEDTWWRSGFWQGR